MGGHGIGHLLGGLRVMGCASAFGALFNVAIVEMGTMQFPGAQEEVPLYEFQLCTITAFTLYFVVEAFMVVLGISASPPLRFMRARFFESVLVPTLSVLLYAQWTTEKGLPPVMLQESGVVAARMQLLVLAVVLEVLFVYHPHFPLGADLVSIALLGSSFAVAVAKKYDRPLDENFGSICTAIFPPAAFGYLLATVIKSHIWDVVPAGAQLPPMLRVAAASAGPVGAISSPQGPNHSTDTGMADELWSDNDHDADEPDEEDDEAFARKLAEADLPPELRVNAPGKRAVSPIGLGKRLRTRRPVLYST